MQTSNNDREPADKDIKTVPNEKVWKDKVRKLLGFLSSPRLQQDRKATETNPELLANVELDYIEEKMRLLYRTMIIKIIRNFEIWQISLLPNETFSALGNRVEA